MPRKPKQKPLATRLRIARNLVREWRKAVFDSEKVRTTGPEFGTIQDVAVANELERFDEAYRALSDAIAAATKRGPA